jgi:hypothetical protein
MTTRHSAFRWRYPELESCIGQRPARRKPSNDNRSAKQPAAIVTAKKPRGRKAAWTDDGQETPPEIKALIQRMMLGRGPGSST